MVYNSGHLHNVLESFMNQVLTFLVISIASISTAQASCTQANLTSVDGLQISLHYSTCNISYGDTASVLAKIHVILPANQCPAQFVYVTLMTSQYGYSNSQSFQLNPIASHSCEYVSPSPVSVNQGYKGIAAQQIAISVENGDQWVWEVDPISQTHQFTYSYRSSYCGSLSTPPPMGKPELCN